MTAKPIDEPMRNYPGFTPLTLAAHRNDLPTFRYLVAQGADINKRCPYGWAPIHLALHHSDKKIARLIVEHKLFDVNVMKEGSKETPLMYAILFERKKLAEQMLARKDIDLTLVDAQGLGPRDYLNLRSLDWKLSKL